MSERGRINVTRATLPPYEEYINAIRPLWDSHWLTNMGQYHKQFEEQLKNYLQVPELSLMVNGHMALEMAIQAFEFPIGGEVITTPFTFISTTHAIIRNGLSPVFCDIKMNDFTIDEAKIESLITEKTVAIVPVHVYGNVCNVEEIERIAAKHDLSVIYDAAHAFGVKYKGVGIGNYGNASIFSFHATKVFHSIEGGAVSSNMPALTDKLYNLKNFGIRSEETVVSIGANAKMNEFQAIMGLCNLNYIEEHREARKNIFNKYYDLLSEAKGINLLYYDDNIKQNYAYFPIIIEKESLGKSRDDIYELLKINNIHTRKYFFPLTSDQLCFGGKYEKNDLEIARYCSERVLALPIYPGLSDGDVIAITKLMTNFIAF